MVVESQEVDGMPMMDDLEARIQKKVEKPPYVWAGLLEKGAGCGGKPVGVE